MYTQSQPPFKYCTWSQAAPMGTLPARAGDEEEKSWSVTKSEF